MVLVLTHDEVAQLVILEEAVKVMEAAYESLGKEEGVERPRTHTYVPLEQPDLRYLFKSMDESEDLSALGKGNGALAGPERTGCGKGPWTNG